MLFGAFFVFWEVGALGALGAFGAKTYGLSGRSGLFDFCPHFFRSVFLVFVTLRSHKNNIVELEFCEVS